MLAITGLPFHDLIQTFTQQDIDHSGLFQNVAAYTTAIHGAQHVRQAVMLAASTALAMRGVAHVALPADIQEQKLDADKPSARHKVDPSLSFGRSLALPQDDALARAAAVLNAGGRIAILAGQGALGAAQELEHVAEILRAPVAKALLGKAVMPDTHPHVTGGVGISARARRSRCSRTATRC